MGRNFLHTLIQFFQSYRLGILLGIIWIGIDLGSEFAKDATAFSATYWMQIFSFQDYSSPVDFYQYMMELRTGIPPLLSALEIYSFNTWGDNTWIFQDLYQGAIFLIVLLPFFFTKGKTQALIWCIAVGAIFFRSILLIHPGNPQYYDVLLPSLILLFLLFAEWSFTFKNEWGLAILLALMAGICLGISELTRPYMLALLPFLLAYAGFHYLKNRQIAAFIAFLLPVLLISGSWHAKLIIHNNGQVIWSNSSGTNLYRAWSGFVDNESLEKELQEEAPPLLYGRWENLNTQVHFENSQKRKAYVWKGIRSQPGRALQRLWKKILIFVQPQTAIYEHKPEGTYIALYRILVKGIFLIFPLLVFWGLRKIGKAPAYFFSWEWYILMITGFLSLMPIIGESGEEARFVISVLPFLSICGILFLEKIQELIKDRL